MKFQAVLASLLAMPATVVLAHGEPSHPEAIAKRDAHLKRSAESLSSSACAAKLAKRVQDPVAVAKRAARTSDFVNRFRAARGLEANFEKRITQMGEMGERKRQNTCILAPEQEEGPYYVSGELVRDDITENEPGIDLLLDVNLVDATTCEPLTGVIVDFWHCNATGVYSDERVEGTLGETYFRGLVEADADGVVQVATKVPGWYGGRAQHIHIKAHVDYTINADNTISGGTVPHTGQIFFDQDLLTEINKLYPYTLDTNPFTDNSKDNVIQNQALTTAGYDAYIDVTLTGSDVSEGLLGEITIVIDPSVTGH